jgi:hypothetical protein
MRLPRFRVRTLLVLVAAVAVLIWGSLTGLRSYGYYRRASFFASQEYGWRQIAARGRSDVNFASECAEYFARLTRKYRRATWRPWMPVAPDPHAPGYDQWLEQERQAKAAAEHSVPGATP